MMITERDLNKLQCLKPANLTDDDILYLFKIFSTYDFSCDVSFGDLKQFFALALEVLKFKGEEAAFYELESKHYADVLQKDDVNNKDQDFEDLRQQLLCADVQNNQLASDLKACEKELLAGRNEIELLVGKVAVIERENVNLRKEVASLHEETNEHSVLSEPILESSEVLVEKHQKLLNSVCQKNKHIVQLLADIEVLEKENLMLRDKLTTIHNELSMATQHLKDLSGESTSLQFSCREKEEKLVNFEQQNLGLRNQVQEMTEQNMLRDTQIDDFTESIYNRMKQWEDVFNRKNFEIEVLQFRVEELSKMIDNDSYDCGNKQMGVFTETLQKREEQIQKLQKQLTDAAKEINDSAAVIESFKHDKFKNIAGEVDAPTLKILKSQLLLAEEKIELLKNKLKDAEEDSKAKAMETSEMIVQLREYESGEFGLADAVSALKATRAQCFLREGDALEAVQMVNRLQLTITHLQEQNLALRKKLRFPFENDTTVDGLLTNDEHGEETVVALKRHTERMEEEKVKLKFKNRKLCQSTDDVSRKVNDISGRTFCKEIEVLILSPKRERTASQKMAIGCNESHSTPTTIQYKKVSPTNVQFSDEKSAIETQLTEFINENEALRRGMHEILECIRNQDGSSDVHIQSDCLERLLEALDLRHVSGWYHPAMRLQAQIKTLEGSNTALREQLHAARLEERRAKEICEKAKHEIERLEVLLECSQKNNKYKKTVFYEELSTIGYDCVSSADLIEKLNFHLLEIMNETLKTEDFNKSLEHKWKLVSQKYNMVRHEIGLLYLEFASAKADWQSKLLDAMVQKDAAERRAQPMQAETTNGEELSAQRRLRVILRERSLRLAQAERWGHALQASQAALQLRCEHMAHGMWQMECAVTKIFRNMLLQKDSSRDIHKI